MANNNLHTVTGLYRSTKDSINVGDDEYLTYGLVPDMAENEMTFTLLTASACLGTIAQVVFEEFEIDTQELVNANGAAQYAALDLIPSKRRRLGRNDPCWCDSGEKLKNCHEV
jgi:uncharacterized protein YecA (UPF0149 family)